MKTNDLINGLQILSHHYDKPNGFNVGAGHDVIYAFSTDKPLSKFSIRSMIQLGWHQEYDGIDYNKDFSVEDYRQDESWVCYI